MWMGIRRGLTYALVRIEMANIGEVSGTLVAELSPGFCFQGWVIHYVNWSLKELVEGFRGLTQFHCKKYRETSEEMEVQKDLLHFCVSLHIYSLLLALSASLLISVSFKLFYMSFWLKRLPSPDWLSFSVSQLQMLQGRIWWASFGQVPTPSPIRCTLEGRVPKKSYV